MLYALGVARAEWAVLLDPLPPAEPACWQGLAGRVLAAGDGSEPLRVGQHLASPGLAATALSSDSHALALQLGGRRWLLLPDRQALRAWQADAAPLARGTGLWLGVRPGRGDRAELERQVRGPLWISGRPPGPAWPICPPPKIAPPPARVPANVAPHFPYIFRIA